MGVFRRCDGVNSNSITVHKSRFSRLKDRIAGSSRGPSKMRVMEMLALLQCPLQLLRSSDFKEEELLRRLERPHGLGMRKEKGPSRFVPRFPSRCVDAPRFRRPPDLTDAERAGSQVSAARVGQHERLVDQRHGMAAERCGCPLGELHVGPDPNPVIVTDTVDDCFPAK